MHSAFVERNEYIAEKFYGADSVGCFFMFSHFPWFKLNSSTFQLLYLVFVILKIFLGYYKSHPLLVFKNISFFFFFFLHSAVIYMYPLFCRLPICPSDLLYPVSD